MGGQESKPNVAKYGQIFMKTENPYYMSGETVKGAIYLNLISSYPGNELTLKILGRERVNWAERRPINNVSSDAQEEDPSFEEFDANKSKILTKAPEDLFERSDKKVIIKFKVPIHRWQEETVPPGQYTFPFCFIIPYGVPGSFYHISQHFRVEIKYSLLVKLAPLKPEIPPLQYEHEFFVKEHVGGEIKSLSKEIAQDVTSCFCINKGNFTVRALASKNAFTPGETATIKIESDTRFSQVPILRFHCTLKQKITAKAATYHETKEKELILGSNLIDGVDVRSRNVGDDAQVITFRIPESNDGNKPSLNDERKIFKTDNSSTTRRMLSPSCKGQAIECNYYFEIVPEIPRQTCGRPVRSIQIPFQVYAPLLAVDEPMINIPPNWKPLEMPVMNFAVPSSISNLNPLFLSFGDNNMKATSNQSPEKEKYNRYSLMTSPEPTKQYFNRDTFGVVPSMGSLHHHHRVSSRGSYQVDIKESPMK